MTVYYKYPQFFTQSNSTMFDELSTPGSETPHSGIYRCEGCGHEITSVCGHTLPPQNHHQHLSNQGSIRWRFIAWS